MIRCKNNSYSVVFVTMDKRYIPIEKTFSSEKSATDYARKTLLEKKKLIDYEIYQNS